jgi:ABC-type amino acid transport substrate-binding protein
MFTVPHRDRDEELKKLLKGKRIGVTRGTTNEDLANRLCRILKINNKDECPRIIRYDTNDAVYEAMTNEGKVEFEIVDNVLVQSHLAKGQVEVLCDFSEELKHNSELKGWYEQYYGTTQYGYSILTGSADLSGDMDKVLGSAEGQRKIRKLAHLWKLN